jgi:predicted Zn-dependent peptidase
MKSKLLLLLALAGTITCFAAPSSDYEKVSEKKLFNGDTLYEFRLPNKLTVLLVPRHQAKVLTYQTWFDVGSLEEKLDPKLKKTGLAHLFEHMMFRGSEKYPDGKFDEITARLGGDKQNATTYFYRTNYFESVPSSQLERIMELESDRMANLKLTKELFEKEKGAVVGELRRHLDNPGTMAFDELNRTAYQVAPFRYTVIGTEDEIKGFTLEEGQYYYKTYYAPNNATLIVIGDTTEEQLMPLVKKYYGEMKMQSVPHGQIPAEPKQKKERKVELTHPQATSEMLVVGYHVPSIQSPDTVPLSLLSTHLSRGTEAQLRKLLVDKGIAVGASANASNKPDIFEFVVQMAEGHKAEEALRIVDKEIASLQKKKIGKQNFERALNQELLNLYGDITDNSELGNWLGEYLMISGDYMRGFQIIEDYKKVTEADVMRVSKDYLRKDNRSVVILRPAKAQKKGKA